MRLDIGLSISALALILASPTHAAHTAADDAAARAAFQEAYARVSTASADAQSTDSTDLKSYALYPYLQAARIRRALEINTDWKRADERAAEFIGANGQLPVSRGLRHAWLGSLARRSQWTLFLSAYEDAATTRVERCESFVARIELGKIQDLAAAITTQWLTSDAPPECNRAFGWLKRQGALTVDLIEARARVALESGRTVLAREVIAELPRTRAAPFRQWVALLEHPQRSIDAWLASPDAEVDTTALLAGWTRFARAHPALANERYVALIRTPPVTPETSSPYALALALALARDRDPAALERFGGVSANDLDDNALGWRARAALWSKDWNEALRSIATLSESSRQSARWRYWNARATEALYDLGHAQPQYESLLSDDNYYSALAASRLHRPVTPHPRALTPAPQLMASIEQQPAIERARELFLCGMQREAAAEWRFGYETLSQEERVQSVMLAASWGWYTQAAASASAQRIFNDYVLLYPQPFFAEVKTAAQLSQLTPELIYAVLRQESLYRSDAVSSAGARGLMQLMPETARRTARQWQLPRPTTADLFEPAVNIPLGAANLRMLLDQLDNQMPVALAGYNAGIGAARRWLPAEPIDADVWIENIPYEETRDYVQRVLWHSLLEKWLHGGGHELSADTWLADIAPLRATDRGIRVASKR
jgi:soluble lytic murein transglycosylase